MSRFVEQNESQQNASFDVKEAGSSHVHAYSNEQLSDIAPASGGSVAGMGLMAQFSASVKAAAQEFSRMVMKERSVRAESEAMRTTVADAIALKLSDQLPKSLPDAKAVVVKVELTKEQMGHLEANPIAGVHVTKDMATGKIILTGNVMAVRQALDAMSIMPTPKMTDGVDLKIIPLQIHVSSDEVAFSRQLLVQKHHGAESHGSVLQNQPLQGGGSSFVVQEALRESTITQVPTESIASNTRYSTAIAAAEVADATSAIQAASQNNGNSASFFRVIDDDSSGNRGGDVPRDDKPTPPPTVNPEPEKPVLPPVVPPVISGGGGANVQVAITQDAPVTSFQEDVTQALQRISVAVQGVAGDVVTVVLALTRVGASASGSAGTIAVATSSGVEGAAVTSHFDAATGVWTATGHAAEVNELLSALSFTSAEDSSDDVMIAISATAGGKTVVAESFTLTGTPTNDAPEVAEGIASWTVTEDDVANMTVDADAFHDMDAGDTLSYSATLGDGSALPSWLVFDAATRTFSASPVNADVGSVTVKVTAEDSAGATSFTTFAVVVENTNDTPTRIDATTSDVGEDAAMGTVVGTLAAIDPDAASGDEITFTIVDETGSEGLFAIDGNTIVVAGTLDYEAAQTHNLTIRATDNDGEWVDEVVTITVVDVNEGPNALSDADATNNSIADDVADGTYVGITAQGSDPEGDTLTYRLSDDAAGRFAIDAASGEVTVADASRLDFDHAPTHTITVEATDGADTYEQTFTISLTNTNDAPTVDDGLDNQVVAEDAELVYSFAATAFADEDADDSLSYEATLSDEMPLPSWLSFDVATRTFTGTPTNADVGVLQVRVSAVDGSGERVHDDFTITISDTNDAPDVQGGLSNQTAAEDTAFSYQFSDSSFGDMDGDSLVYVATLSNGDGLPSWLSFDAVNRTFSGTPDNDDVGSLEIRVTAEDSRGGVVSDVFVLDVTNTNDAPTVAAPLADAAATEDSAFTYQFAATAFADVDAGDSLSYTATLDNGAALPAWLSFNATTRSFTGTPTNADVGSLTIRVTATDTSGATVNDSFSITVGNTNDAPTVAAPLADATVNEDSALSYQFATTAFADEDGDALTYSATLDNGTPLPSWLSFDAATRSFTGTPTNADVGSLTIRVTATDTSGATVNDSFRITVGNTNDAPTALSYAGGTVAESTAVGTVLGTFTGVDEDLGDTLTYSFASGGNPGGKFSISGSQLLLAAPLDYETATSHAITVVVTDAAGASHQENFTIAVSNINDAPSAPADVNASANTVAENSANGTLVGITAHAVDPEADTVVYSLTDNAGGRFTINASSGQVMVANAALLNYEAATSHTITVQATDGSSASTQNFTIAVTDVAENPTDITLSTTHVAENSALGTVIGTLSATDPDAGSTFTYAITSDPDGKFTLSGNQILVNGSLNYEVKSSHVLGLRVTDNTGRVYTETMTIGVDNINDLPILANQTFAINENSAVGALAVRSNGASPLNALSGYDEDGNALTYTIVSGNVGGAFSIHANTGEISVANSAALDYETRSSYVLEVAANDGTVNTTGYITININNVNEAPVTLQDSNAAANVLAENAAISAAVGITARATDPEGGALTYSLTDNAGGRFAINASTGVVTLASALDYETAASHTITVAASDGVNTITQNMLISVTNVNDAPVYNDASYVIAENSANGSVVGTSAATDAEGSALTYSIVSGNSDGLFTINAATGALSIANNTTLNHELTATRTLTLLASDGALTDTAAVTVIIADVNEAPVLDDQAMSVADDAISANGDVVGTLSAVDPDSGQALTYTILGGNEAGVFALNAATGTLTVANDSLLVPSSVFTLQVQVTDNGTGTLSDTATITINVDNTPDAPVADDVTWSIAENSANNTVLGSVHATDADGNAITYSITAGNNDGIFAIDATTGAVRIANNTALNYEYDAQHVLTITATDNSASHLTDTATVTVNVQNINEAPVLNDATLNVAESVANGAVVTTLAAADPDAGQTLTYSIVSGNEAGAFALNASTGALTIANAALLDYETGTTRYDVNIVVTDNGTGALTDTAVLGINITNVNEAPVNSVATTSFTTNEDTAINVEGLQVADVDSATPTVVLSVANGALLLRNNIVGGVVAGQITGNGTSTVTITGATQAAVNATLAAATALTYTPTLNYNGADTLTFTTSDGSLTDVDTMALTVNAINDAPVVANPVPLQSMESNATWSYTMPANTFTDAENNALTYSVQFSSNDGVSFASGVPSFMSFNAATRTFAVASAPGNPNVDSYILRVSANDGNGGITTHDITFNITAVGLTYAGATAQLMIGTNNADLMSSGAGNDTIYSAAGGDTIYSNDGNDVIYSDYSTTGNYSSAGDLIYAGAGNDTIFGEQFYDAALWNQGADTIFGEAGNDSILAYNGHDSVSGGDGADYIDGSYGYDTLQGDAGTDHLYGGNHADVLDGGAGNDQLRGGEGADTLTGGAGVDTFAYDSLTESANSTTFDVITDFDEALDILRLPIFNMVTNGAGMASGRGLEWYQTGTGETAKTIIRSDGVSLPFYLELTGHKNLIAANFSFFGTFGSLGNDTLNGTSSVDAIMTLDGNDSINAGSGNDQVWAGVDNDTVDGGAGDDVIYGEAGDDYLSGGQGSDYIYGGDGNDTLIGEIYVQASRYYDTLVGGLGNDTFKILHSGSSNSSGSIYIEDFEVGYDKIDLRGVAVTGVYIGGGSVLKPFETAITYDAATNRTMLYSNATMLWGGMNMRVYINGNHATNVDASQNLSASDFIFGYVTDNDAYDTDTRVGYIREASSSKEAIIGTSGADTIYAGVGGDEVNSGDGDDVLVIKQQPIGSAEMGFNVGAGNDKTFITAATWASAPIRGNSQVAGSDQAGSKSFIVSGFGLSNGNYGGSGNDFIVNGYSGAGAGGGSGDDIIYNGRGDDSWTSAGGGNDIIYGGEGNENQALPGNAGDDTVIGGYGSDFMWGGDVGNYAGNGNDTFVWYDPLEGRAASRDVVFDFGSTDKIVLHGFTGIGAGATELTVTQYSATQYGVPGGSWTDIAASNAGIDFRITILGTHSFTVGTNLILNAGTVGTSGSETMNGTASGEFIFGEVGNDTINGNAGNDSLFGGDSADSVLGGADDDSLSGGYSDDTLVGGTGKDTLEGGSGVDIFKFVYGDSTTTNADLIWDFREGGDADKIDLSSATLDAIAAGGTLDFTDLTISTPDVNGTNYTRITITGADFSVDLLGYYEGGYNLNATDFIF